MAYTPPAPTSIQYDRPATAYTPPDPMSITYSTGLGEESAEGVGDVAIGVVASGEVWASPTIVGDLTVPFNSVGQGMTDVSGEGAPTVAVSVSGIAAFGFQVIGAAAIHVGALGSAFFSAVVGSGAANVPFGSSSRVVHDWLSLQNPIQLQEFYTLTITGSANGQSDLKLPVSSWQATSQAEGRQSYLQAVVPAAAGWLDEVSARQDGELVIRKGYRFSDGTERAEEIQRSSFDDLRFDRGARSFSLTLSGYLDGQETQNGQRSLSGIRSITTTGGKYRVRCSIDLFLRPGMTVIADDVEFTADYINYYVSNTDKFCEVSER